MSATPKPTAYVMIGADADALKQIVIVKNRCMQQTASPIVAIRFRSINTAASIFGKNYNRPDLGAMVLMGMCVEADDTLRGSMFYIVTSSGARFGGRFMDVSE